MGWMQKNSVWRGEDGWSAPAGATGPLLTYVNSYVPTFTSGSPTATATGVSTGPAGLVVVVIYNVDAIATVSSASIQGVPCSGGTGGIIGGVNSGNTGTAIIYANVPGTSGNIVVNFGSNLNFGGLAFDVYSITGLSSITPTGSITQTSGGGAVASLSGTLATTSGGVVIVGSQQFTPGNTDTVTGTETYTADHASFDPSGGFQTATTASAHNVATNASSSVLASWNASQDATLVAGAWR